MEEPENPDELENPNEPENPEQPEATQQPTFEVSKYDQSATRWRKAQGRSHRRRLRQPILGQTAHLGYQPESALFVGEQQSNFKQSLSWMPDSTSSSPCA
ncbi:MAG: hypothetical protein ACLUI3_07755 [Christensenellales bacterium]